MCLYMLEKCRKYFVLGSKDMAGMLDIEAQAPKSYFTDLIQQYSALFGSHLGFYSDKRSENINEKNKLQHVNILIIQV